MRIQGSFRGVLLTHPLRGPRRELWLQMDHPLLVTAQRRLGSRWETLWQALMQEGGALVKGAVVRLQVEGEADGVLEVW